MRILIPYYLKKQFSVFSGGLCHLWWMFYAWCGCHRPGCVPAAQRWLWASCPVPPKPTGCLTCAQQHELGLQHGKVKIVQVGLVPAPVPTVPLGAASISRQPFPEHRCARSNCPTHVRGKALLKHKETQHGSWKLLADGGVLKSRMFYEESPLSWANISDLGYVDPRRWSMFNVITHPLLVMYNHVKHY